MTVKARVVYTPHSSAWRMFVLETQIENVSAAARRECWGGSSKVKRRAKLRRGTVVHFIDPLYINLCVKTGDYLEGELFFPVKHFSVKILSVINGHNLIICIWIQACGAVLSSAAQCQKGWSMVDESCQPVTGTDTRSVGDIHGGSVSLHISFRWVTVQTGKVTLMRFLNWEFLRGTIRRSFHMPVGLCFSLNINFS